MSSPRRPGGQPGNTNSLEHGFYAPKKRIKLKPQQLDGDARLVTGLGC